MKLTYVLTVLILLLLGIIGFTLYSNQNTIDTRPSTVIDLSAVPTELPLSQPTPTTPVFSLRGKDGVMIPVLNFIKNQETVPDVVNPNNYVLAGDIGYCLADGSCPAGFKNDSFHVRFSTDSNTFTVTILKEPVAQARIDAELFLLSRLEITKDTLCNLNVSVGVPYTVSDALAGVELGVSGCPNSQVLP